MALESVTFIDDLVATNPVSNTDIVRYGADHIRNLKTAIKNSFAGCGGVAIVFAADSSAVANTITLTPTPAITEYTTRMLVVWHQAVTNTGAVTMNISALGAKNVVSVANAALTSGDLVAGRAYVGEYDGTSIQLLAVTKNYVDQQAFSAALPAQSLGLLISDGTNASFSKTFTGFAVNTVRATVASHATTSAIWAAAGNEIDFTGSETITDFPDADVAGASRILHCASTPTFTNNANISVQGAENYTAAAGDIVTVHAITTTTFRVTIEKANGEAIVGGKVVRRAITTTDSIGATDKGKWIDATSGTFTLSATAAATLGDGFWCYVGSSGSTNLVTVDPNGSETVTIKGTAYTTFKVWPGEVWLIVCDGSNFHAFLVQEGAYTHTVSGAVASVDFLSLLDSMADDIDVDLEGVSGSADAELYMRFANGSGTADTGSNYTYNIIKNVAGTVDGSEWSNGSSSLRIASGNNVDAPTPCNVTLQIKNVNSTNLKSVFSTASYLDGAGTNYIHAQGVGNYKAANVSTGIQFFFSSGNIDAGTIRIRRHIK